MGPRSDVLLPFRVAGLVVGVLLLGLAGAVVHAEPAPTSEGIFACAPAQVAHALNELALGIAVDRSVVYCTAITPHGFIPELTRRLLGEARPQINFAGSSA